MDISNTPTPAKQPRISAFARVSCCITLLLCSGALPVLTHYINLIDPQTGAGVNVPTAIAMCALLLCATFFLVFCRKPVFLTCAIIGGIVISLLSPWFGILFVLLLCATVAGATQLSDAKITGHIIFAAMAAAAYLVAFFVTRDALLSLYALIPALGALALSICHKRKYSIIVSIGVLTGTLTAALVLLIGIDLLVAGMPFSIQGITDAVKSFHAAVSSMFAQTLQTMTESEEWSAQVAQVLGGEIAPEKIVEFSNSVATATLGLLPGTTVLLFWIFSFIAHRGYTAMLVKGMPKEEYPKHLTEYAPSVPTAVLMILCYVLLIIGSLFTKAEVLLFIAINLLMIVMPILTVSGILGIVAAFQRATTKWPLILTYVVAVMLLGFGIIPMLAFYGAFGVIATAIARILEQKMNSSEGGQ